MMGDERPAFHFKGRAALLELTASPRLWGVDGCVRGLRGIPRAGYVYAHGAKQKRKDEHKLAVKSE